MKKFETLIVITSLFLASSIPVNSEAATNCQSFQGYAKGNWRKKTEYVLVNALLCGKSQITGKLAFHWENRLTVSDIQGSTQQSTLEVKEVFQKGNGSITFAKQRGWLNGIYTYYHREYSPFEVRLTPAPKQFAGSFPDPDLKKANDLLLASSRKDETWSFDPILASITLAADQELSDESIIDSVAYSPRLTHLNVQQLTQSNSNIVITEEQFRDDSIGKARSSIRMKRLNPKQTWQISVYEMLWRCQPGRGHQDFSRKSCI